MITYTYKSPLQIDPLFKQRVLEWVTVLNLVKQYFKDDVKASEWMFAENPLLGNVTPHSMIEMGRFEKLKTFILQQMDERQAP